MPGSAVRPESEHNALPRWDAPPPVEPRHWRGSIPKALSKHRCRSDSASDRDSLQCDREQSEPQHRGLRRAPGHAL